MRRWPLTVGMVAAAVGAAWVAPRLLPAGGEVQELPQPAPEPGPPWVLVHRDRDGDGFGDEVERQLVHGLIPAGYAAVGGDCNDDRASVHPGAAEVPGDGLDQDCDGRDGARAQGIPELDERVPVVPLPPEPDVDWDEVQPACGMG